MEEVAASAPAGEGGVGGRCGLRGDLADRALDVPLRRHGLAQAVATRRRATGFDDLRAVAGPALAGAFGATAELDHARALVRYSAAPNTARPMNSGAVRPVSSA